MKFSSVKLNFCIGAERPGTRGGTSLNLGRNDRIWGGRGADVPGADRLRGGSTVSLKNDQPEFRSGRVQTDPITSAGHGFREGMCPLRPPPSIWILPWFIFGPFVRQFVGSFVSLVVIS